MAGTFEARLEALMAKYQRPPGDEPVPAWILPPLSCEFLSAVAQLLPASVRAFEFGSGQSTRALRRVTAQVSSIENSAHWLNQTEEGDAVTKRAGDYSAIIPLRRCWNRMRAIESFDLKSHADALTQLQQSQLILVDSPPNPAKREHALFLALSYAPVGAVIILDDLEVRAVERFASRLARQNQQQFRFWTLPIDHQLGVFYKLKRARVRSLPSLREFVGTWLRA
jgi:hypothetical protein